MKMGSILIMFSELISAAVLHNWLEIILQVNWTMVAGCNLYRDINAFADPI